MSGSSMILKEQGSELIFVGGSPRSGTTLVQNILNSHPDIFGGPEFLHLPDIISVRGKLHGSINRGWIDKYCSAEDVDDAIRTLIESLLLPLMKKSGRKLFSEKTPENVLVFSQLMAIYPHAHCINVIRDPRAIVASMLQVGARAVEKGLPPAWFTADIVSATQYATQCLNAGMTAAGEYPNNILTVVYERLVSSPEEETKRLCDFLGLEWSERMLHPGSTKHMGEEAITKKSGEIWYTTEMYYRDPVKDEIDKWKTQLSSLQKAMVDRSFKDNDELEAFGYKIRDPRQSYMRMFMARVLMRVGGSRMLKQFGVRLPASVRTLS